VKADSFKYLGRVMSSNDSDWLVLQRNLVKARKCWAMISRFLGREGAAPCISGYFHKAAILVVALCGSESWVWTKRMFEACQGFHHHVARRIAGTLPVWVTGQWTCPPIAETLEVCGLSPLERHIARRWKTILTHVKRHPICTLCLQAERAPGTPANIGLWWEDGWHGAAGGPGWAAVEDADDDMEVGL